MAPRVWAAVFYHVSFAALGAIFPFLPVLARGRQLGTVETGLLLAIGPTANALVPPLWGRLADRWRARATLLALSSFACAGFVWLLATSGDLPSTAIAFALLWLFRAPLVPLADATARAVLGPRGLAYGYLRAWGSLGYALAVFVVGTCFEISRDLVPVVAGASAAYLVAAFAALKIGDAAASRVPLEPAPAPSLVSAGLPRLLLVGTGLYGGAHAISDGFFPFYVLDLGHSEAVIGVGWGLGVGLEILVMLAAPRLLARFDAVRLLQLAVTAGAIRWLGVAGATAAVPLVLLQLIHAVSFGLWYVALVEAVQRAVPSALRATAQGAITGAIGLGQVVGFVAGSELYDLGGGPLAFACAGGTALAAAGLYGQLLRQRRRLPVDAVRP